MTLRTLEGVGYRYGVPADTEFPYEVPEFWLYARMIRENEAEGVRALSASVTWLDGPQPNMTYVRFDLGPVRFSAQTAVASVAWPLRPIKFPGLGRYQFDLAHTVKTWRGTALKVKAHEWIALERLAGRRR